MVVRQPEMLSQKLGALSARARRGFVFVLSIFGGFEGTPNMHRQQCLLGLWAGQSRAEAAYAARFKIARPFAVDLCSFWRGGDWLLVPFLKKGIP